MQPDSSLAAAGVGYYQHSPVINTSSPQLFTSKPAWQIPHGTPHVDFHAKVYLFIFFLAPCSIKHIYPVTYKIHLSHFFKTNKITSPLHLASFSAPF